MSILRRQFLLQSTALLGSVACARHALAQDAPTTSKTCRLGLVTYLWGKDLTLPELITACEQSEVLGVELRTTHRHGVEPTLTAKQRDEVRSRFDDSPVTLVGLGSDERFDNPDPQTVRAAIEKTKTFIQLSHDVGGTGVKVKGDRFHPGVPHEQTIRQVASALREIGDFADRFDQQVRLEVHGGFRDVPTHHQIISQANHPRVRTCWNSNPDDLAGDGLRSNFDLVSDFFGQTVHVRQLDSEGYPWATLIEMFVQHQYDGWILLEAHGDVPADKVAGKLRAQRTLFDRLIDQAIRNASS